MSNLKFCLYKGSDLWYFSYQFSNKSLGGRQNRQLCCLTAVGYVNLGRPLDDEEHGER